MQYATSCNQPLAALATACLVVLVAAPALASGRHEGGHGDSGQQQQQERAKDHGHGDGHGHGDNDGHGHTGGHGPAFGGAAPAHKADRRKRIVARDAMRFEPSTIEGEAGQTARFLVHNAGEL